MDEVLELIRRNKKMVPIGEQRINVNHEFAFAF